MKTVHKYELHPDDEEVLMPIGAEVLTVQEQNGKAMLWALVDPAQTLREGRTFSVYGTGSLMPEDAGKYVATFQLKSDGLVFHVFDRTMQAREA